MMITTTILPIVPAKNPTKLPNADFKESEFYPSKFPEEGTHS